MRGPARLAETFKNFKNLRISHSHVKIWPLLSTFAAMTFFRQSQVRGGKLAGTLEFRGEVPPAPPGHPRGPLHLHRHPPQDWHNVTVLEELERAVAVAKDRVGEEQSGRTPAKLSKEGAVKTGGAAEGRKGRTTPNKEGKTVKIDEKVHGAAKECREVACTDDESPTGDKDKEEGKLLGKRKHCEKEEEDGRMNEVQKVQRQWEKEREEELGDDMSQEGIFM